MTLEADQIVERRRLKRSRAFWRFTTIAAVAAVIISTLISLGVTQLGFGHVARVEISGVIFDDQDLVDAIDDVADDKSAKALIVAIDSPGGTVTGSEAVYNALRRVGAKKPVVAVMGSLAASGGYAVALAGDHVVAQRNTITGSIGVIMQAFEMSGLLDKIGVSVTEIKSAPLKGEPSEFHPMSPEARKATEALIADAFEWFVGLVAERRKLAPDEARKLSDGRVYSGKQALAAGLIDAIGNEDDARAWLEKEQGISEDLPLHDVDTNGPGRRFNDPQGRALAALSMLLTGKVVDSKRLTLDGLVAIWHPAP